MNDLEHEQRETEASTLLSQLSLFGIPLCFLWLFLPWYSYCVWNESSPGKEEKQAQVKPSHGKESKYLGVCHSEAAWWYDRGERWGPLRNTPALWFKSTRRSPEWYLRGTYKVKLNQGDSHLCGALVIFAVGLAFMQRRNEPVSATTHKWPFLEHILQQSASFAAERL